MKTPTKAQKRAAVRKMLSEPKRAKPVEIGELRRPNEGQHDTRITTGEITCGHPAFGLQREGDVATAMYDPSKPLEPGCRVAILWGGCADCSITRGTFLHRPRETPERLLLNHQGKLVWVTLGKSDIVARFTGTYTPI
jgi:hypothetical protein